MPKNDQLKDEAVGSGERLISQGECLDSIAFESGHFWKTIWNHPSNKDLKAVRKDPNTLLPGDKLFVPPIETKELSRATDAKHTFRRKGVPSMLRIYCMHMDKPLGNLPYRLIIDGKEITGTTSPQGLVEQPIPPDAKQGFLMVQKQGRQFKYELDLGHLDPVDTTTGVKARLANLGFDPGPIDSGETPEFSLALRGFQEKYGLEQTGKPDPPTLKKLDEIHR